MPGGWNRDESPFHPGEQEVQKRLGVRDIEDWARKVVRDTLPEERGDFDGAIADYDAALAQDPGYSLAHANRGNAFAALGQIEEAIYDLRRAYALGYRAPWLVDALESMDAVPADDAQ